MNTTISVSILVLSIIVGIMYHEYGHLIAAKRRGISVKKYVIGFGKPFISRKGKDGIEYGIAPIPMGGYCDIDEDELNNAPFKHYVAILLAGVFRNLILAFVLCYIGICLVSGELLSPFVAIPKIGASFLVIIQGLGESLKMMFNLKEAAQYGGIVSQFGAVGSSVSSEFLGLSQIVGASLIFGGVMNFALALFNALPIPAIDGGQIVMRMITDFAKKIGKPIQPKIINTINMTVVIVLMGLQGIYFLMDIPLVRQFFLNWH